MPRRPVHLPLYAVIVLVVLSTLGPLGSVAAAVQISEHRAAVAERQRQQDIAANRDFICVLIRSQLDAYDSPSTPTGQEARKSWVALYARAACKPDRK